MGNTPSLSHVMMRYLHAGYTALENVIPIFLSHLWGAEGATGLAGWVIFVYLCISSKKDSPVAPAFVHFPDHSGILLGHVSVVLKMQSEITVLNTVTMQERERSQCTLSELTTGTQVPAAHQTDKRGISIHKALFRRVELGNPRMQYKFSTMNLFENLKNGFLFFIFLQMYSIPLTGFIRNLP